MNGISCAFRSLVSQRPVPRSFRSARFSSKASRGAPDTDQQHGYGKSHPDKQDLPLRAEAVLNYWYDDLFQLNSYSAFDGAIMKKWFQGGPEVDKEIKDKFGSDIEKMAQGEYDSWLGNTYSSLAAVIIMDQFSRVVYRGTPGMFALDSKCYEVAKHMMDTGKAKQLKAVEKMSLFLPFMHQEDAQAQKECVKLYEGLLTEVEERRDSESSEALQKAVAQSITYAQLHKKVIDNYGRFPHRNTVLGRSNTPEEDKGFSKGDIPSF